MSLIVFGALLRRTWDKKWPATGTSVGLFVVAKRQEAPSFSLLLHYFPTTADSLWLETAVLGKCKPIWQRRPTIIKRLLLLLLSLCDTNDNNQSAGLLMLAFYCRASKGQSIGGCISQRAEKCKSVKVCRRVCKVAKWALYRAERASRRLMMRRSNGFWQRLSALRLCFVCVVFLGFFVVFSPFLRLKSTKLLSRASGGASLLLRGAAKRRPCCSLGARDARAARQNRRQLLINSFGAHWAHFETGRFECPLACWPLKWDLILG